MTKNMLYSLFFILAALIVACSNKAIADAIGQPRDSGCIPISFETPKSDKVKRFIWRNLLNKYDDHYPTKEEWNATFVALVDLNGDGQNDVIVTRKDYCGSDGCSLTAIISTQKGGYEVDIAPSVYLSSPVCLMPKRQMDFSISKPTMGGDSNLISETNLTTNTKESKPWQTPESVTPP